MIYFIGNKEQDLCKIGHSKNVIKRANSLTPNCPFELEIFLTIYGSRIKESVIHEFYKEHRVYGEWFKLSKVLPLSSGIKDVVNYEVKNKINNITTKHISYKEDIVIINDIKKEGELQGFSSVKNFVQHIVKQYVSQKKEERERHNKILFG